MRNFAIPSMIFAAFGAASCAAPPDESISAAAPPVTSISTHPEARAHAPQFDRLSRVPFVAGLSFALPAGAHAAYPQGIDSSIMHISDDGFEIMVDDYGAWRGPGSHSLGGRPARMSERRANQCRERIWEVELPTSNPTMLECPSPSPRAACVPMPAHASISSFCTTDASCSMVDGIIGSARFAPLPEEPMPSPQQHWSPPTPVCRIEDKQ